MTWHDVPNKNYGPTKRIPVGIVCDISSSMEDVRDILNESLVSLCNRLKESTKTKKGVDLLLIFFNGETEVRINFESLETIDPDRMKINRVYGYTDTGKALLRALSLMQQKKNEYKAKQRDYWQPLLFLITDGYPCAWKGASDEEYKKISDTYKVAAEEIHRLDGEKLVFVSAGIQRNNGVSANIKRLRELSDRVLCVSEDITGMERIDDFIQLIGQTIIYRETEIDDVIHDLTRGV